MSKKKHNSPEASLKRSGKASEVPESGPRHTGKDVSSEASVRRNHPGKRHTKEEHDKLVADHSISGFDVNTLGSESFPKKATAANDAAKARRRKD